MSLSITFGRWEDADGESLRLQWRRGVFRWLCWCISSQAPANGRALRKEESTVRKVLCLVCVVAFAAGASANTIIDKPPDIGNWWHPVGNNAGGSWVYADSFIAPEADTTVDQLGTWLDAFVYYGGPQHSEVAFQVWGGGDAGPDYTQVIASTDPFSTETPGLNLYVLEVTELNDELTPGERYWFIIDGAGYGDPSYDDYQTGGHTQNSVYQDNGTFWYSNDPAGQNFDGQNLTPEMAFQVYLIPEPASMSLLGLGVLCLLRRR